MEQLTFLIDDSNEEFTCGQWDSEVEVRADNETLYNADIEFYKYKNAVEMITAFEKELKNFYTRFAYEIVGFLDEYPQSAVTLEQQEYKILVDWIQFLTQWPYLQAQLSGGLYGADLRERLTCVILQKDILLKICTMTWTYAERESLANFYEQIIQINFSV